MDVKTAWTKLYHYQKYGVFGDALRIEASSVCQLQCQACPQTLPGELGIIKKGFLTFHHFKSFVDTYPSFKKIELSNWGEIFLNPDLLNIMRYAQERQIHLTAENGVNFNAVSPQVLEGLVRYRFQRLRISLDGASQQTYSQYRQKGHFDTVIGNINKLNAFKQQYKTSAPRLSWQFIIFGHNEHELEQARQMARDLDMTFEAKLNWSESYSPVKNDPLVRSQLGHKDRREYEQKEKRPFALACESLWRNPQINWDGRLLGCCCNIYGDFGNVFTQGLRACLQSERYRYAKKMVQGLCAERKDIPCCRCGTYQKMLKQKIFLDLTANKSFGKKFLLKQIFKTGRPRAGHV